jgi:hypothetical protein
MFGTLVLIALTVVRLLIPAAILFGLGALERRIARNGQRA